jgi:hypothetical protein
MITTVGSGFLQRGQYLGMMAVPQFCLGQINVTSTAANASKPMAEMGRIN